MKLVRIIKEWDEPDVMRQTPRHSGTWGDVRFTFEPVEECDYLIILNRMREDIVVSCDPRNIWAIFQEPPVPAHRWQKYGHKYFERVYTQDTSLSGKKYILSHGALPWQVDKDYDFFKKFNCPDKPRNLSFVTSNKSQFPGHVNRLTFLDMLRGQVDFDLWGRGFTDIDDKLDGLSPYRYSLAIENYSGPYYWTEKIGDCFLAWTMPIYYGCTNITDYFPEDSLIQIDIKDPDVVNQVKDIMKSDLWVKRRDAIAHARELVLDKYQLLPFIADRVSAHVAQTADAPAEKKRMVIPATKKLTRRWRVLIKAKRYLKTIMGRLFRREKK